MRLATRVLMGLLGLEQQKGTTMDNEDKLLVDYTIFLIKKGIIDELELEDLTETIDLYWETVHQ